MVLPSHGYAERRRTQLASIDWYRGTIVAETVSPNGRSGG